MLAAFVAEDDRPALGGPAGGGAAGRAPVPGLCAALTRGAARGARPSIGAPSTACGSILPSSRPRSSTPPASIPRPHAASVSWWRRLLDALRSGRPSGTSRRGPAPKSADRSGEKFIACLDGRLGAPQVARHTKPNARKQNAMGKIIGIDLGTTNTVVAIMEGKEPKVIANEEGARLTPSVVAWDDKGEVLVGQIAKPPGHHEPREHGVLVEALHGPAVRPIRPSRRRPSASPTRSSQRSNGDAAFEIRGKRYSPPEIGARVLMKLKKRRRGVPGRDGHRGGHHRARVLQRQRSARPPRTRAASPASRSSASSTSRRRRRSRTGSTRRRSS